jgi:hypothetical protein
MKYEELTSDAQPPLPQEERDKLAAQIREKNQNREHIARDRSGRPVRADWRAYELLALPGDGDATDTNWSARAVETEQREAFGLAMGGLGSGLIGRGCVSSCYAPATHRNTPPAKAAGICWAKCAGSRRSPI